MSPKTVAYGSWKSPITTDLIVGETIQLGPGWIDGDDVYWLEGRPAEAGRNVLVRQSADGRVEDVTPAPFNVRTRAHEYGGGAYRVDDGVVIFSNFADQRLYRHRLGEPPEPITPETDPACTLRYADADLDRTRGRLILVREDHREAGREAKNSLCALDPWQPGSGSVLAEGYDFYSSPRISPDGTTLAWLCWNHPNMPWDESEVWIAGFAGDGSLLDPRQIAGGKRESIYQPEWSPDGNLHFVSDRSGWRNLYRVREGEIDPLYPMEAEFGMPQWVFGMTSYAFESPTRLLCTVSQRGRSRLWRLDLETAALEALELGFPDSDAPIVRGTTALVHVASPTAPAGIARLDLSTGKLEVLRRSSELELDPGFLSAPESIEFPSTEGTAHAHFHPPRNRDFQAPPGELPPLLVVSHGGPTSSASVALNLTLQYFTSRGFGVVNVDYGGSTGYGREYQDRLQGSWGIVDVDDCENAALYLAAQGRVDRERLAIRGGSAGGYTTLAALTFRDTFRAGASHYGVSDLEVLTRDTHKFESRYLDGLIGPYPERRDLYRERSPIHHTEQLCCPVIVLQGLEDKVVPPNQAEMMVEAVASKGLPVAYLPFEGEQHGFRRGENIKRALEAEFYFYSRIFGFEPADSIEPLPIQNL